MFAVWSKTPIPRVTYVQGDLHVNGGRTIYGIFYVEGDIILDGSSQVEGVLYMINPYSTIIHGGGSPSASSVTGGIVANGDVMGTGNHIDVRYNPAYMSNFASFEQNNGNNKPFAIKSWWDAD